MNPATLFYIMSSLGVANSIFNPPSSNVNEQNPGTPAGGATQPGTGPLNTPVPGVGDVLSQLGYQQPGLNQASGAAAQAAGAAAKAGAGAKLPDATLNAGSSAASSATKGDKTINAPAADLDIGEILAAIPAALQAVDVLFNQSGQNQRTQRPAPVAGMAGGGLVGQFAQPYGQAPTNIGQLLAALPGIR